MEFVLLIFSKLDINKDNYTLTALKFLKLWYKFMRGNTFCLIKFSFLKCFLAVF